MPTFEGVALKDYWKRLLQISQTGNSAPDTTTRNVEGGDGTATAFNLSDDVVKVQPKNDDGSAFTVGSVAGTSAFNVNTSTFKITAGGNATNVLTQYANFGIDNTSSASFTADNHFAIPFGLSESATTFLNMGSSTSSSFNDTNPASTLTLTNTTYATLSHYWYLQDNITIDKVEWFSAADTATGDVLAAHLMKYDLDKGNSATSGDLSSGTVMFDGASVTNNGYEQMHYQEMDDQVTTARAGQVIIFTVASDTINSDYSIRCFVKYHIT